VDWEVIHVLGHQYVYSSINAESDAPADPANGNELGQVADMNVEDTKKAIDAASNALPAWSRTTAKVIFNWFPPVTQLMLTPETGKTRYYAETLQTNDG
jgi:acyl-CoA reductase-like NAD-dependent aldehyde dehydrogenase